jgi:hypothetical protein
MKRTNAAALAALALMFVTAGAARAQHGVVISYPANGSVIPGTFWMGGYFQNVYAIYVTGTNDNGTVTYFNGWATLDPGGTWTFYANVPGLEDGTIIYITAAGIWADQFGTHSELDAIEIQHGTP